MSNNGSNFLKPLLTPPGSLMLIGIIGWVLLKRRPRLGKFLIALCLGLLYASSTPIVASSLLIALQVHPALDLSHVDPAAKAIVVLGADQRTGAEEFQTDDTVSLLTLERIRYGAFLSRATGIPLLTSGGTLRPSKTALAILMKQVIENEFGVKVRWVEDASRDTQENARFSIDLLKREGISKILLVTHAWHMPRAKAAFEKLGMQVVPAPTAFRTIDQLDLVDFLPSARALHESSLAFHEWIGRAWYALLY